MSLFSLILRFFDQDFTLNASDLDLNEHDMDELMLKG